jgi:cytochrome P450
MSPTTTDELSLSNLLQPELRADPYPFSARLRSEDPVHWDEAMGFWIITRYADVAAIYRDPRFSRALALKGAAKRLPEEEQERTKPLFETFGKSMTYADPPYHTRLRGLANKAFTPRMVEQMRQHIQHLVDTMLDAVADKGQMDAIRDLAYPLPATVIMEMLGLPAAERDSFKKWSDDLFATLGVVRYDPQVMSQALASLGQLGTFIDRLREQVQQQPQDDLFSALVMAAEDDSRLSGEELLANTMLLLTAGHETTMNLIGNGLLALLRHPDQMQKLRDDPTLITNAIEEMLRYDNPAQIAYRVAAEDAEIGGKQIGRGQIVNLILGAANRDPAQFPDPNRFDITRANTRHIGFGVGIHFCLGAPLARLEGQLAIATVLNRFPNLRLTGETLEWHSHPTLHGLNALPVAF